MLSDSSEFIHPFNRLRLGTSDMLGTIPSSVNTTFIPSRFKRTIRDCRIYLRMLRGKKAKRLQGNQRSKVEGKGGEEADGRGYGLLATWTVNGCQHL